MAVVITSEERPKTRKKTYTLQLRRDWSDEKKSDEIEYHKKLKRIPEQARPNIVTKRDSETETLTWTWYETEFDF